MYCFNPVLCISADELLVRSQDVLHCHALESIRKCFPGQDVYKQEETNTTSIAASVLWHHDSIHLEAVWPRVGLIHNLPELAGRFEPLQQLVHLQAVMVGAGFLLADVMPPRERNELCFT